MKKSISILIPAFNEEENIAAAVASVTGAIRDIVDDYELIIINDGSRDRTGEIAERLQEKDSRLKVIHNPENRGFGYSYRVGIAIASKDYLGGFPGDNDMSPLVLRQLITEVGREDAITSYMTSMGNRTLIRRVLSRSFVFLLNHLFGLRLKYYNGAFLCRLELMRSIPLRSNGLTILAEALVKMLKRGCSCREICFEHTGRKQGKSSALTFRSLKETAKFLYFLVHDIYLEPQISVVPVANIK